MIKDCGFYTFSQFKSKNNIGSSRLRAEWLCNYWPEAEIFVMGQEYKTVIFQKAYWTEYATLFKGLKILDICDIKDADWYSGAKKMIKLCDGITTSTEAIASFIRKITDKPVYCIPDRLDFNFFPAEKKEHHGDAKIVAWQGYNINFPMLAWAIPSLIKNGIEKIIIISNSQYNLPLPKSAKGKIDIINIPWEEKTINQNLLKADIVINPHFNKGKWQYKSNNKTITAWALGLPVAQTEQELKMFIPEEVRKKEAASRYEEVRKDYDVKQSVVELKNFISYLNGNQTINLVRDNFQDFIPNWSPNKKYLKKGLRKKLKLYKIKPIKLDIDAKIGKIGIMIRNASPKTYEFLKKLKDPSKKTE